MHVSAEKLHAIYFDSMQTECPQPVENILLSAPPLCCA